MRIVLASLANYVFSSRAIAINARYSDLYLANVLVATGVGRVITSGYTEREELRALALKEKRLEGGGRGAALQSVRFL